MFAQDLPDTVNRRSLRVAAGAGTIHRTAADGSAIYRGLLDFPEILGRIERCYLPYHAALQRLIRRTQRRFGICVVLDCHSMPSAVEADLAPGAPLEFVLGDRHGGSCAGAIADAADRALSRRWSVRRNDPYAGAFVSAHYGRPDQGIHVLQIEVNRTLYMDEERLAATEGFLAVSRSFSELIAAVAALDLGGVEGGPARRHSLDTVVLDN
jgi:N-formylglutamate amidohydrolase